MKKLTQEDVITQFINVHGNRYDYTQVEYVNNKLKVNIICKEHGLFMMSPNHHKNGKNCHLCVGGAPLTQHQVISQFINVHGNRYDYSLVIYIDNKTPVDIICKEHGVFQQSPNSHKCKKGCLQCGQEKSTYQLLSLYNKNSELGSQPGIFYKLKFKHKELKFEFIKIGITRLTIKERYRNYKDYTYEILEEHNVTNLESAIMEKNYMKTNCNNFVFPKNIHFKGHTECYKLGETAI